MIIPLRIAVIVGLILLSVVISCNQKQEPSQEHQTQKAVTASEILGNSDYPAISYGGYRQTSRDIQPNIEQLKNDMRILHAMGIRVLRTYNVQLPHAGNVLRAISELKAEDANFEMYVMLGAWIDCKYAWTDETPDHNQESEQNAGEVARAVTLVNQYPDIVKVLAIGNEAMVRWATSYYVQPSVILKWVKHCQELKTDGKLPADLWITSSDDFASWGGGDLSYRVADLEELIRTVDFVSMHTYPYHNTHYNPDFWGVLEEEGNSSKIDQVVSAMGRALQFAQSQYDSVATYVDRLSPGKQVHIGETGWASVSNGHYGPSGSKATDEYKQALYHQMMRDWTSKDGISCFYFEAFDEPWKDQTRELGSENHFGLFKVDGRAKYALWDMVDQGVFEGLTRGGNTIQKTYDGDLTLLLDDVDLPPVKQEVMIGH